MLVRGYPSLVKGARLKILVSGKRSRSLGFRGFKSRPPHHLNLQGSRASMV